MSVMGFKKNVDRGWVGGVSSIHFFLDFWNFFNLSFKAKPMMTTVRKIFVYLTCLTLKKSHPGTSMADYIIRGQLLTVQDI